MLFGFRSSHLKDLNISVEVIVRTQELYEIVLQASTFVIAELTEAVKRSSKCDGRAGDNSTLWVLRSLFCGAFLGSKTSLFEGPHYKQDQCSDVTEK